MSSFGVLSVVETNSSMIYVKKIDRKIRNNITVGAIKNLGFIFDYNSIIYFIPESV